MLATKSDILDWMTRVELRRDESTGKLWAYITYDNKKYGGKNYICNVYERDDVHFFDDLMNQLENWEVNRHIGCWVYYRRKRR